MRVRTLQTGHFLVNAVVGLRLMEGCAIGDGVHLNRGGREVEVLETVRLLVKGGGGGGGRSR